jgi:hypothetical protein
MVLEIAVAARRQVGYDIRRRVEPIVPEAIPDPGKSPRQ